MKFEALKAVGTKAGAIAAKTGMKLRRYSPEIMLVGGTIAFVGTVVAACIATKKAQPVIEEAHEQLDLIEAEAVNWKKVDEEGNEIPLTQKEIKKETFKLVMSYIWKFCKIYGLTAFLFILSLTLIFGSHGVLKKRYVSTTLAYKALDEAFKDYRSRIKEAVGEEKERHFFNGTEECGEVTTFNEEGESVTTKEAVKVHDKKYSPYEFDFNANTAPGNWEANTDYNFMFLRNVENYLNDLLNSRGHVFLNEALDAIGLKRTREGAVTGWIKGGGGDDYVDLGIFDYYTDDISDAQNGKIRNIHLNFNVDGLIWDKI